MRVDSKDKQGSRFSFLIPLALPPSGVEGRATALSRSPVSSNHSSLRLRSRTSSIETGTNIDSLVEALASDHMAPDGSRSAADSARSSPSPSPSNQQRTIEQPPPLQRLAGGGNIPGIFDVVDSNTPVRPVKVDNYEVDTAMTMKHPEFGNTVPTRRSPPRPYKPPQLPIVSTNGDDPGKLRVLIVEVFHTTIILSCTLT